MLRRAQEQVWREEKLAAEAAAQGVVAVSFDRDLRRFSDIRAMRPREALERVAKR